MQHILYGMWSKCSWTGVLIPMLVLILGWTGVVRGQEKELPRERVISIFLLNAIYYGQWQPPLDWKTNQLAKIGILGEDTLGPVLRSVADDFREQRFKSGRIAITNSLNPADLIDCHVVYVSENNAPPLKGILESLGAKPILLVSATRGFAEQGGTFELRLEPGRPPRWDLNLDQLAVSKVAVGSAMKARAAGFIQNGRKVPNKRP